MDRSIDKSRGGSPIVVSFGEWTSYAHATARSGTQSLPVCYIVMRYDVIVIVVVVVVVVVVLGIKDEDDGIQDDGSSLHVGRDASRFVWSYMNKRSSRGPNFDSVAVLGLWSKHCPIWTVQHAEPMQSTHRLYAHEFIYIYARYMHAASSMRGVQGTALSA